MLIEYFHSLLKLKPTPEVHLKLVNLLAGNSEGHVLYCVMTSLATLALSWSSLHPVPAVQVTIETLLFWLLSCYHQRYF